MTDDFGFFAPVSAPLLERVMREEHIGREHPRKRRDEKQEQPRTAEPPREEASSDQSDEAATPASLTHIDLRI